MKELKKQVVALLRGGQAHATFEQAVKGISFAAAGKKPRGEPHSPWELIEHIRIAQRDILDYSRGQNHESPAWPDGYWPKRIAPATPKAWKASLDAIPKDLAAFIRYLGAPRRDLLAPLPHDRRHNLLRQALLLADHNAYHIGQLVLLRKRLGNWLE